MEHINQLNKWAEQLEAADMDAVADMDVAARLLNHGIEALDKLEAAKQRELELLAVIEKQQSTVKEVMRRVERLNAFDPDKRIAYNHLMAFGNQMIVDAHMLPSQALREHEAKVVAEYKQKLEAAEAKLRELEMQDAHVFVFDEPGVMFTYENTFPAPKQEEK